MASWVKKIKEKKNGFGLIEVLIAMFIMTVVGVAFLITLQYALKANMLDKAHTTAESLARSQLEYEKSLTYLSAPWTFNYDFVDTPDYPPPSWISAADYSKYSGFLVQVTANPLNVSDDGVQNITVTVSKSITVPNGADWDVTLTVDGYKIRRQG